MVGIENYSELFTLGFDFSQIPVSSHLKASGNGIFYHVNYDVILRFGLTELEAMIAWKENVRTFLVLLHPFYLHCCQGVERRSAAKIIYNADPTDDVS